MIAGHNSRDGEPPMFPPGTPLAAGTFKAEPFAPDHAEWLRFAENLGGAIDVFRAMAASWGPALRDFGRSCALCARADAAERLAVALVELFACPDDDGDLMRQVREEYNKALAAWRAIMWENQP